jgi:hypothetical protein
LRASSRGAGCAALLVVIGLATWAGVAAGQADSTCNPCLALKDRGIEARGEDVLARHAPELARGEWGRVAKRVASDFRSSQAVPRGHERDVVQAQLDEMATEMMQVEQSPNASALIARAEGVRQARFTIDFGEEVDEALLFKGGDEVVIRCDTWTAEARRGICEMVFDAQRLLIKYGSQGRQRALNALNRYVLLWDNFNENGLSMMPWELAVNGWWAFKPGSLTPPKWQLVLAHPALGLEVGRPADALRRLEVGTLEPLGFVVYRGDRRTYVGGSALITVPSGEDFGYGGMLHLGRSVKAGYVWREERSRSGVVLSADLYQMIAKAPELLRDAQARVTAVRDSLSAASR